MLFNPLFKHPLHLGLGRLYDAYLRLRATDRPGDHAVFQPSPLTDCEPARLDIHRPRLAAANLTSDCQGNRKGACGMESWILCGRNCGRKPCNQCAACSSVAASLSCKAQVKLFVSLLTHYRGLSIILQVPRIGNYHGSRWIKNLTISAGTVYRMKHAYLPMSYTACSAH